MRDIIVFLIANYSLTFLLLAFVAAGISLLCMKRPLPPGSAVEALLSWYLLLPIGLSYLFNFVMHVFFQDVASRFIGWAPSPFETEVGFASLGFGIVALLAFKGSDGLRLAAVLAPACFMLGAAAGHVHQMIVAQNFAPGNAGAVFYTDIAIPVIGLALLYLQRRQGRPAR